MFGPGVWGLQSSSHLEGKPNEATRTFFMMLAASTVHAATVYYYITTPVTQNWMTASTYQRNQFIANTVYNPFTGVFNQGQCPVRLWFLGRSGNRYVYKLDVLNVPAGATVSAIVRNNSTGFLGYSQINPFIYSSAGTYYLGTVNI